MTIFKTRKVTNHLCFARVTVVCGKSFLATRAQIDTLTSVCMVGTMLVLPVAAIAMGV